MRDRRLISGALALVLALTFSSAVAPSQSAARAVPAADDTTRLRTAIAAALDPDTKRDTKRGGVRLPGVRIDPTGDATVVFALRDEGTVAGIRDRGAADVLTILRAVYHPPVTDAVRTITVIGTFPVAGNYGKREWPVMRAVLARARADSLDWDRITPADLPHALDVWWVYPPLLAAEDAEATPGASPVASPPATAAASPAASSEVVVSSPIDIGGRRLFLRCIGSGSPTVILEAGYGDNGEMWAPVQLPTARFARVCSYDRAGLERSDPAPSLPRTAADVVADLHALLAAADVEPPYVLVGHSVGGLFTRLYASTYPDEVVGMVLVDAWPEDYDAHLEALVGDALWTTYEAMLADEPDYEVIDLDASFAQVRAAAPLRPMPLVVISHGQPPDPSAYPPGWPIAQAEALWQSLQDRLVALAPGARHVVARQSGHQISQSEPELVAASIRDVAAAVRAGQTGFPPP